MQPGGFPVYETISPYIKNQTHQPQCPPCGLSIEFLIMDKQKHGTYWYSAIWEPGATWVVETWTYVS